VLVVLSNRVPDRLEIEPADRRDSVVRLVVGSLEVSRRVTDFAWHETVVDSLAQWFKELDEAWRGWEHTKDWTSMEGDFELSAAHDGRGTVTLTVYLKDGEEETWTATGQLERDAGGFGALLGEAAGGGSSLG
jgi:Family of unknown function (DUF6228)